MFTIKKRHSFEASHRLENVPEGHPCGELHGHSYRVEVVLRSDTVNDAGFVLDFNKLDPLFEWIDEHLDHAHLNDVLPARTSAELIARAIYNQATLYDDITPVLHAVRVSETRKSWATYTEA